MKNSFIFVSALSDIKIDIKEMHFTNKMKHETFVDLNAAKFKSTSKLDGRLIHFIVINLIKNIDSPLLCYRQ